MLRLACFRKLQCDRATSQALASEGAIGLTFRELIMVVGSRTQTQRPAQSAELIYDITHLLGISGFGVYGLSHGQSKACALHSAIVYIASNTKGYR